MKATQDRQYYMDWLRVVATVGIFLFHNSRAYDYGDWSIKNATTNPLAQAFTDYLGTWGMPFIFVISGASAYLALAKGGRGARATAHSFWIKLGGVAAFLQDKALRLLVPVVVGIFTHIALQIYLERISHGQFSGSFFEWYPHYFEGVYGFGGNFALIASHPRGLVQRNFAEERDR